MLAVSLGNEHAATAHGIDLLLAFATDLVVGPSIAFLAPIFEKHPQRIAKVSCRLALPVDDFQLLKELPYAVVDAVAEFVSQPHVVLEAGREIAKHRVDLR